MDNLLIAFDLDDTLFKERDFVFSAYRFIAAQIAEESHNKELKDLLPDAMRSAFLSGGDAFSTANLLANTDIPVSRFLEWYRFHSPDISLDTATRDTLDYLKRKGHTLALITDGRSRTQRNKIETLHLFDFISPENIIVSEEFGSEKPDERNYKYFSERYPDMKGFVYVGDNVRKDFVTPNRLGWKTVGIRDDGRNIHPQNLNADRLFMPQIWIDSIARLKDLF